MKALSFTSLALALVYAASEYAGFYYYGALHVSAAFALLDLFMPLFVTLVLFPILVISFVISLARRRDRIWTCAMLMGFLCTAILVRTNVLRPEHMQVYGIHDRVMKAFTLDDLRQFAKNVHQEIPDIMILHDDGASLNAERVATYRKLQHSFPFLTWGVGSERSAIVQDQDGVITVQWGSPLMGHFGLSVSIDNTKKDLDPIDARDVIRASDDIYFFGWR
jgi:hypothetical protein